MSKRKKQNGFNPRIEARHRLDATMRSVVETDVVNEQQLARLIEGIKTEISRVEADRQEKRDGVFAYHDLAEQELKMFMNIEAGTAAEARQKIRMNNIEADAIGQEALALLENKKIHWKEIKPEFEAMLVNLDGYVFHNAALGDQLGAAQIAVAETFAPRMALVELYYKHTAKHLSELLTRQENAAVEWGLHAESSPKDILRFLNEKFSYEKVLGLEEDSVDAPPPAVEEVVGAELEDTAEVFDTHAAPAVVEEAELVV